MAKRNWGHITSGATFETLAATLIFFEDSTAKLFGRRGKDGGQDARSGDETRVFQAKHHEQASAAAAIRDAKKEADKIARYRAPGHPNYERWRGVQHWRLVTNAMFNSNDDSKWKNEVVPLFKAIGFQEVDYWGGAALEALLDKYPEVDRSFFKNETRALLSLPEARERLLDDEPFLRGTTPGTFHGREDERRTIREFLESDKRFLAVHGAGGMGKTRLLVEAGEEIAAEGAWQVLWALVASMTESATWFDGIVPERPTLLLVDDPPDARLLQKLSEQLGLRTGRASQWKVAVAVRSPNDPVLRFLSGPRIKHRVQELPLDRLSNQAAEDMCRDLVDGCDRLGSLPEAQRAEICEEVARRFSQHPVWLTLAIHLLETHGDLAHLPTEADGLAALYVREIVENPDDVSCNQILDLLRWVALIGTVRQDDEMLMRDLAEAVGFSDVIMVKKQLARLVERRALARRGAWDRLIEVKPDVLRDHLLIEWLCSDVGHGPVRFQPSGHVESLNKRVQKDIRDGKISPFGFSILTSLARTELLLALSERPVALLDPLFDWLHSVLKDMTASQRRLVTELLVKVANFRPIDTAKLCRAMRSSVVATETVEGLFLDREIGQDDIVLELAWPLFGAAMGARTSDECECVLQELCALIEAEWEIANRFAHDLPNDGQRAADLVRRTLEGGPQFWSEFHGTAKRLSLGLLDDIARASPRPAQVAVLKALMEPLLELERRRMWSDDKVFRLQRYVVKPDEPIRRELIARIKEMVANTDVPRATRVVLWRFLAMSHRSANQVRQYEASMQQTIRDQLLVNFEWTHAILCGRTDVLEELEAARGLWRWHLRFEKDPALKTAAARLEDLYAANELAREFEPLWNGEHEKNQQYAKDKARELASASDVQTIHSFLDRATRFFGDESRLHYLVRPLGDQARDSESVRAFVRDMLRQAEVSPRTRFGIEIAGQWVFAVRMNEGPTAAHDLTIELMDGCGSEMQRLEFVQRIYGGPRDVSAFAREDHELLRSLGPLFAKYEKYPDFIAAAGATIHHDWPALRTVLENCLDDTPQGQLVHAVRALVNAVYMAVTRDGSQPAPDGILPWLLEQVSRLPDIGEIGDWWILDEIRKHLGRVALAWLPEILSQRVEMEAKSRAAENNEYRVRTDAGLSRYVVRVTEANATNPEVTQALDAMIDLASGHSTVAYHIPEMLQEIDPDGLVVPGLVSSKVQAGSTAERLQELATIAGAYVLRTPAWRALAKPLLARAARLSSQECHSLYSNLVFDRPSVGTWGGLTNVARSELESARHALETEDDVDFRPFWEWHVKQAEARVRAYEEWAKEDSLE